MPDLISPDVGVHASFLGAMAEFRAEGRGSPDDHSMIGEEMRDFGEAWKTMRGFAAYIEVLHARARGEQVQDGFVASTTLWWTEHSAYLGRIAIRHELTPQLRDVGGHIGFDVRPSARRRGHATAMLCAALPVARRLGISAVLITCDVSNIGSRRVIESCGGELEDQRGNKLRFWAPTDTSAGRNGL